MPHGPMGPRFSLPGVTSDRSVRHREKRKAWCVSLRADTIRDDYLTIFSSSADTNLIGTTYKLPLA